MCKATRNKELTMILFRQFYSSLPVELEEASLIDGCGFTKTYLLIMAPNLSNTFFLCSIFGFVWYWTDYYYSLIYLPTWYNLALRLERIWEVVYNSIPLDGDRTVYNIAAKQQATCLLLPMTKQTLHPSHSVKILKFLLKACLLILQTS